MHRWSMGIDRWFHTVTNYKCNYSSMLDSSLSVLITGASADIYGIERYNAHFTKSATSHRIRFQHYAIMTLIPKGFCFHHCMFTHVSYMQQALHILDTINSELCLFHIACSLYNQCYIVQHDITGRDIFHKSPFPLYKILCNRISKCLYIYRDIQIHVFKMCNECI